MGRMANTRLALGAVAVGAIAAGSLGAGVSAFAHGNVPVKTPKASGPAVFLAASLNGHNEVPTPGGKPVGDQDGSAVEFLRIKGNQVSFAIRWDKLDVPTDSHVHLGATGANGAVKVPLFAGGTLPGSINAAAGSVTVDDAAVLADLVAHPENFYANLHTAAFGGGAVRGQFHKVTNPVDLNGFLRGGPLTALMDGGQEVDGPAPVGDLDGRATALVQARGNGGLNFSLTWSGIGAPTNGHLHEGTVGANGPVVVPFFGTAPGTTLPPTVTGVAGVVADVKADLAKKIADNPENFYANLHTAEFGGGAVRGQLFRAGGSAQPANFVASVVKGVQIYSCTAAPTGGYAFTQHNVRAKLEGNIAHSFVKDDAGPPQWIAPDGSAVTGKLIAKTPNGTANIAELDLAATSSGKPTGQMANVVEILRLNTVGGVAPAGPCDPKTKPIAEVPYQADYVFVTK
jgi:hypothetical protein